MKKTLICISVLFFMSTVTTYAGWGSKVGKTWSNVKNKTSQVYERGSDKAYDLKEKAKNNYQEAKESSRREDRSRTKCQKYNKWTKKYYWSTDC